LFDDVTIIEHDNQICILHRREPVRDNEAGASLKESYGRLSSRAQELTTGIASAATQVERHWQLLQVAVEVVA